jgi:hypothetical protein
MQSGEKGIREKKLKTGAGSGVRERCDCRGERCGHHKNKILFLEGSDFFLFFY